MTVNYEIKGMLARLLATEDLIVENKKVETACFNVQTRVLTLPMWEKASNDIYDLLCAHECGHAIFTDNIDWSQTHKIPTQFVNVCEDVRVEKLMKRRYAGLAKTFYTGYKELQEQDFFSVEDEDVSNFNLADRVNLYYKVGNFLPLEFTSEEKVIVDLIGSAETFEDALNAAEELYKYCKKEKEKVSDSISYDQGDSSSASTEIVENQSPDQSESNDSNSSQSSSDFDSNKLESDQSQSQSESSSDENQQPENSNRPDNSTQFDKEPEVQTLNNLENKIKDLLNSDANETIYVEIPQVNLDTVIGKNCDVHADIDACFDFQQKRYSDAVRSDDNLYDTADLEYKKFKSSAQKEVSYLVKEFECRKSADSYSRASISRTGVLDTARLHTYKFSEDLFKKVTVLPDGKNHGLVFVLDWSGSMSELMLDTCKQLFNLIWFCKKVSIPFEVYAFTNEWSRPGYDYENDKHLPFDRKPHYDKKQGLIHIDESFSLMNILTSKVSGKQLEHQLLNVWRLAYCFSTRHRGCKYTYPSRLSLSGTPLNESLITLHQILPKFKKDNKLQKVHCIVLTDGEAPHLNYHVEIKKGENDSRIGLNNIRSDRTFLRDRKLGTTYQFKPEYHRFTDLLLQNLKDNFTSVNFIGMRVLYGRDANRFIGLYHCYGDKEYDSIQNDWKKSKSFKITKSGYDAYFGLSATALSQEVEFEVAECASKAQIKSAFVKSLKTKKLNKKVLGEFMELVS
jgi:hypothetical protein